MMDDRRFNELAELLVDGELTPADAAELRLHLESDPSAVTALRQTTRDHVLCRSALRPSDPTVLAERTRRMLESWRPSSRQVAAQDVLARYDQRRRFAAWRRWGSLAAAALVLILLLPTLHGWLLRPALMPDERAPQISQLNGELRLEKGHVLARGERLSFGATLVAGPTTTATLAWNDGTQLQMIAGTRLTRMSSATGEHLRLDQGSISVRAAHRSADQAMEIICPDAVARIVGTAFTATVVDGRSRLDVTEGLVRWQRVSDGASSLVGAGQHVEAARLPLPSPILLSSDHLAAVRRAISDGREPWASSWAALNRRAPGWLAQVPVVPASVDVPAQVEGQTNDGHHDARKLLHELTESLVGLALIARLQDDSASADGARARLHALTRLTLTGYDAHTLSCDMLAVHGLQAADLLRGLPSWTAADDQLIEGWITRELAPWADPQKNPSWPWREYAAAISIAAWHSDQQAVITLMAGLRADFTKQMPAARLTKLTSATADSQTLFQVMCHVLLSADIARVAGGDITPPPIEWSNAVAAYVEWAPQLPANATQQQFFLRALGGPGPWRSLAAQQLVSGADPQQATYGWNFPTLSAHDPRWSDPATNP